MVKNKGKKILLISVFAIFVCLIAIAKIWAAGEKSAFSENKEKSFYTVLICGADSGRANTDVMMLVTLDMQKGSVNMLQIPRDTFVNPASSGFGVTRINAVYGAAYAGASVGEAGQRKDAMQRLCGFIEDAFCIEIDRYVLMDTDVFAKAVDAVGGIEYEVPFDMDYDDPVQGLGIHLSAGRQMLDGKMAEGLLRYRSGYATGDLGRVDLREGFIREALPQIKSKLTVAGAVGIAAELALSVTTDMKAFEISRFAVFLHGVADENVKIKTISGSPVQNPKTGAWIYYALNKEAALSDINEYIAPATAAISCENFDKNAVFTDDPHGENPYISEYYYSKIKKE